MENKYYEPDIDDFFVGMIYETEQDEERGLWEINEIESLRELEELCRYNSKYIGKYSNIRVKYLDKEDIESLGFKLCEDHLEIGYDEAYQVYSNPIKTGCTINIKWDTLFVNIWYGSFNSYSGRVVFRGIIKNKSELSRILKMIGYENN